VAVGADPLEAYQRAFACDPMSAFGGVICLNRSIDARVAEAVADQFAEVLFARGYEADAVEILQQKPNLRILDDRERRTPNLVDQHLRQVMGGMLVQDRDFGLDDRAGMQVVTERRPTNAEWQNLSFAWKVCKHVRSNAIVFARNEATVGIGAGQMSRVDAVRIAVEKAHEHGHDLRDAVLASDAFFPFPDGPELALRAGVSAVIQPGGSKRDDEVIAAVEEAGATMVFTHRRHFRH
jgi:phosphoribosylaminoimidazolecarboxamide formyltransferase / IMP cyclohydrolase